MLLNPAAPEIFYYKHDIGAFLIWIFIGSPDVDNIGDTFQSYPKATPQLDHCISRAVSLRANQFDLVSRTDPSWKNAINVRVANTGPSPLIVTNWPRKNGYQWSRHKVISSQSERLGKMALGIVKYFNDRPSQAIEVSWFGVSL